MDSTGIPDDKDKAMIKYRRFRNVVKSRQPVGVLIALVSLSWLSTGFPVAVELAGKYVLRVSDCLFNPHISFVIGNAIIVLLLLLSRQNKAGGNSAVLNFYEDQIPAPSPATETEESAERDEQIVLPEFLAGAVIKQASKQAQRRIERTQSENLSFEIRDRPRRELRRAETEISAGIVSSVETVDKLSSEEFRVTIEAFIAKHQRFLLLQNMAEKSR